MARPQHQPPIWTLAVGHALIRHFNSVIHRVAHDMRKRVLNSFEQAFVQLGFLPSISICTCLPQALATSRTTRGNLSKALLMGCMRVLVTEFGGRTGANAQSDRSVFCAAKRRRVLKHGANN